MDKKIFLKLVLYVFLISLLIFSFKSKTVKKEPILNLKEKDTVLVFIGSSRIKKSVNPLIISENLKLKKVYNFGINNATFNHNLKLAKYVIKQKGVKHIIFELSPEIDNLPISVINGFNEVDPNLINLSSLLNNLSFDLNSLECSINMLNNYLFTKISVLEDFKMIFNISSPNNLGYVPEEKNNYKTTETFLKNEDYSINSDQDLQAYISKINDLLLLAANHKTKIKFIVPLNYNQEKERKIVFSLYNNLEKRHTIKYSNDFIQKITKAEYLHDKFHFNSKGATIYSNLISKELANWN